MKYRFLLLSYLMTLQCLSIMATDTIRVNIMNDKVRKFTQSVVYTYYSSSRINSYAISPSDADHRPCPIVIDGEPVEELRNLVPGQCYDWNGKMVLAEGTVRMIDIPSMHNVRDIGGWKTESGDTVKYGLIYRGSEFAYGHEVIAPAEDLQALYDLGIRAEVDLRTLGDVGGFEPEASALGSDVSYLFRIVQDTWDNLLVDYGEEFRDAFQFVVECLRQRKPVYIHCRYGADRTGLLCALIESSVGYSVDAFYKDYELTSFSEFAGKRPKTYLKTRFTDIIGYNSSGHNLQELSRKYLTDVLGVSQKDIEDLTAIMLGKYEYDDTPTGITSTSVTMPDKPYHYDLQGRPSGKNVKGITIMRMPDGQIRKVLR